MGILRAVHRWLEPYKYDNEIKTSKKVLTDKKKNVKLRKVNQNNKKPTELDAVKRGELGIHIITITNKMDEQEAFRLLDNSDTHVAYYHHSKNSHQIAVKFEPNSGFRFYKRDDIKRKKFKPMLYPMYHSWDKTHLIPVGFHGSENDPRLLIGLNSSLNRGAIKKHEDKVIKINQDYTIYWFVNVERINDGSVLWVSTVWFDDGHLLDRKRFHDKSKFHWEV